MTLRGLQLEQFVQHVEPAYFQRYFETLLPSSLPGFWAVMNPVAMVQWLNNSLSADARGTVLEDFTRVSNISQHSMNLLVQAYDRAGLKRADEATPEQLGMTLFIDNREAFDFAWARHLLYSSGSKLTLHKVDLPDFQIDPQAKIAFEDEIRQWFARQAKGDFCQVRAYEDEGQYIFLLAHGSYIRTFAYLNENRIAFQSFRPAAEDILVFDQQRSLLENKSVFTERPRTLPTGFRHLHSRQS